MRLIPFMKCVIVLLCLCGPATAQDDGNVLKYVFRENTTQGKLSGCEILFQIAGRDDYYKWKQATILSGSIRSVIINTTLATVFKVCGYDLLNNSNFQQFRIEYSYPIFSGKYWIQKEDNQVLIDECSSLFYLNFNSAHFFDAFDIGDWKIAYARRAGSQDVVVPVSFGLSQMEDAFRTQARMAQCIVSLIQVD